jgi:poly[(R)-3-hydroxyalkanoate] polymerase subunit PhaC
VDKPAKDQPAEPVIMGGNPFIGMNGRHMLSAAGRWGYAAGHHPVVAAAEVLDWALEEVKVLAGTTAVDVDAKDRRFADSSWQHPLWRRVAQSYLVTDRALLGSVDKFGLGAKSADRARFALGQLTAAAAPTNQLFGNPVAIKKALDTRGRSLFRGGRHLVHDLRHNGGLPSQVDARPFKVGQTVAVTAGQVIHRGEIFELIQYDPMTPRVATIPLVILPPQINRFYFLDLAPGRSFTEYALSRGIQVFMVSWRNPDKDHSHCGLDRYIAASIEAFEVAADVAGTPTVNVAGFCSGGMTELAALSHLHGSGRHLVESATMAVTLVDTTVSSSLGSFCTSRTMKAALGRARRRGYLSGSDLAKVFAWVRPNDLIWNYVVSNYLMGETPPAFDVLAWNADSTNLSAALFADFMTVWSNNSLVKEGDIAVMGRPVDLTTVKTDSYVVGARTDHLVPWQSAYAATQLLGGDVRFVLSNSGHIQALVNPPDNPKASLFAGDLGDGYPADPEQWLKGATLHRSSWWVDWADWLLVRSGESRPRPKRAGNRRHRTIVPAPGEYVHT